MDAHPEKPTRILGGVLIVEDLGCRFEVWAYRKLTDDELLADWKAVRASKSGRGNLRGKTLRLNSNRGLIQGL